MLKRCFRLTVNFDSHTEEHAAVRQYLRDMLLLGHKHSLLLKKSDFCFYEEWGHHWEVEHRKMLTCYLNRLLKIT